MTEASPPSDVSETIKILVAYESDEDIETIRNGLCDRDVPPRPRRGPISETAQLWIAGAISLRILANGLIDWGRRVRDTTIFVDALSEPDRIKVYSARTAHARRIVFLHKDGRETVREIESDPAGVAAEIRELLG